MVYNLGKKERIVELLKANRSRSFALEEICSLVTDGTHGKSTVYRLVSELVKDGCLRRITEGQGRRVTYQFMGDCHCYEHLHLKCRGCGRLVHLSGRETDELVQAVHSLADFTLDGQALLFGRCALCREGGNA